MKIFVLGNNPDKIGGGWSFIDNFKKGNWELVDNPEDCDIYFIPSASMVEKMSQIPDKKVVLRIDNALLDSRNGRIYGLDGEKITRMEALKQIANKAQAVVYQSKWSRDYLKSFIGPCKNEQVIINGSDDEIFDSALTKLPRRSSENIYLYIRSSNHDNKGWHIAHYEFEKIHSKNKEAELWIVGRFSPENNEHDFDFFNGENYKYWGYIKDKEMMALLMRSADMLLYPFYNDACSQTLIESYLSGLRIKWLTGSDSGGSHEIRDLINKKGREVLSYKRMNNEYKKLMEEL